MSGAHSLLGKGIYSVPEAARLAGVNSRRIHRWMLGYEHGAKGGRRAATRVVRGDLPESAGQLGLSFLDLVEIRFVNHFRETGVAWRTIRVASERAAELLGLEHPFSTRRFRTDGKAILLEIAEESGEGDLLDLVQDQMAFGRILAPFLYKGLDFEDDVAARWWPMDRRHSVVLDPARVFGQPIVDREEVPTATLAAACKAEGSAERAAQIYEVRVKSVLDAVEFENRLRAA